MWGYVQLFLNGVAQYVQERGEGCCIDLAHALDELGHRDGLGGTGADAGTAAGTGAGINDG